MKDKFPDLFVYTHHFNQKLIDSFLLDLPEMPEKAVVLMNHILNAHQVWNSRILGKESFHPWQMNWMKDLRNINQTNYETTLEILNQFELANMMSYTTTKGDTFENKIEDVLFHVVNHSTYHRGQIATLFREAGIEPLVTDYVLYKRNLNL
jgi:uncharacterized damage-inducible protein DinB